MIQASGVPVPGRPGQSPEQAALVLARAEIERLLATLAEQAVALHLHEGRARRDRAPAQSRHGRVTATRDSAETLEANGFFRRAATAGALSGSDAEAGNVAAARLT